MQHRTSPGGMMSYAGDITVQEAWNLLETNPEAHLIDVRTVGEWIQIGVPDLTSINRTPHLIEWTTSTGPNPHFLTALTAAIGSNPTGPLLFLCRSGNRSISAAIAATNAGLPESYNILAGFEGTSSDAGWQTLGLPTTAHHPSSAE